MHRLTTPTHQTLFRLAKRVRDNNEQYGVLSSSERSVVALILNRPDWIKEEGDTLAEAIHRVDDDRLLSISIVARVLEQQA